MTTTRKVFERFAWLVAAIAALAIGLYVVAFVVNAHDQPPSDDAKKLTELLEQREQVPNDQNAYIFVLGFSAPEGTDPLVAGLRRRQWLEAGEYRAENISPDPFPDMDLRRNRPAAIAELSEKCRTGTRLCVEGLELNSGAISEWSNANAFLLERYRALLTKDAWREFVSEDVAMPLPAFHHVLDAQRLHLFSLWLSADATPASALHAGLDADLRFWRGVLASSDLLITKMIAVAAIRNHFALGNAVLRRTKHEAPSTWYVEFSPEERSMWRVVSGEFKTIGGMLENVDEVALLIDQGAEGSAAFFRALVRRLYFRLYQYQDTMNQLASRYVEEAQRFDEPWSEYNAALLESTKDRPRRLFPGLYNPMGKYIFEYGAPEMGTYAARIGDLEGMRRAVLLTAKLRFSGGALDQIAQHIGSADLKDHYTGQPFEWSADERAVVFVGLEGGERGRHVYSY